MTRDELIRDLAAIVSGLAVPVSLHGPEMRPTVFGAAYDPWVDVYHNVGMLGYHSADDVEDYIRRTLEQTDEDEEADDV